MVPAASRQWRSSSEHPDWMSWHVPEKRWECCDLEKGLNTKCQSRKWVETWHLWCLGHKCLNPSTWVLPFPHTAKWSFENDSEIWDVWTRSSCSETCAWNWNYPAWIVPILSITFKKELPNPMLDSANSRCRFLNMIFWSKHPKSHYHFQNSLVLCVEKARLHWDLRQKVYVSEKILTPQFSIIS